MFNYIVQRKYVTKNYVLKMEEPFYVGLDFASKNTFFLYNSWTEPWEQNVVEIPDILVTPTAPSNNKRSKLRKENKYNHFRPVSFL